ncbi:MAG TPA: cytochrome c oxidase subunit 3 [Bryobacteraceae bacterium]|nr:cytochrome c oxidase subunit 3 [Bryobacteraceae bacterium]
MTRRAQFGMAMFLVSEGVFFALLILAFWYFRQRANLNFAAGAIDTGLLLASALSVWRAADGSRLWVTVTMVLGAAFLIGQSDQYVHLIRGGVTISAGLFGTTFFTLTGMHGLQVLAGLIALAVVPRATIRAVALYWQFLAAVWVLIFLSAYVWGAA